MTKGIYKLEFSNTDKIYIGQSIHIETRFTTHLYELRSGSHSVKLQEAYNRYGEPTLSIIETINKDEDLDALESIT